ncbi:DoxX family protein [Algoriphagus marincola]|jgi:putative oxidoreductase|uniref:DoxX family protein n=1 Tax=Algoriphagus marincola TaxID=264027 RepID=A0ABS7N4J1_9BACT|nr:DoxX family protein [Algoriphagus marincola]MBY5951244.1 DoxX family protein [Algoriphagus marincola]
MRETLEKNLALLILRLGAGGLMLTHGIPKINRLMADEVKFADPFGLGPTVSLALATFAEVVCAVLVIIGFKVRLATIPLMITMLTAAFYAHWDDPFGRKELPLLFFICFLSLLIQGGGNFSIDGLFGRKKNIYKGPAL